ncbi:MAG TPA: CAP domain-containing protein, partial [Tepidiformaceae bacterium]|nr:CAP domain-containing protein [Tepidiformaceae bacterium]
MYRLATLTGVLVALVYALASPGFTSQPTASAAGNCEVADASNDGEELAFLSIINSYRAEYGLTQLRLSAPLNRAAEWMARDMMANGYFGHIDSLGRHPFVRTVDCGYPIAGGENLAAGRQRGGAQGAFDLFRGSPSHNENMLAPEYREIGIARVYGEGTQYGWYWATTFGSADTRPAQPAAPAPAPATAPAQAVAFEAGQAAEPAPAGPPTLLVNAGAQVATWAGEDTSPQALLSGR